MGDYMFGLTYRKPSRTTARRWDKIAREHGGEYVEVNVTRNAAPEIRNGRYQGWFAIDNYGEPFDRETSEAILRESGWREDQAPNTR